MKQLTIALTLFTTALTILPIKAEDKLPKVEITEITELDIIDQEGKTVHLDHGELINSKVGGSIPEYDSKYDSWDMDFYVFFDRPIADSSITLYGEIVSSSTTTWSLIELLVGQKLNKVWVPIVMPKLNKLQGIRLIKQMLGSDFVVKYNQSNIFSKPYALNFISVIEKFATGVKNHSLDNLGTTITVQCCLINPNDSDIKHRKVLKSYTYKFWDNEPVCNLFNTHISRYDNWTNSAHRAEGGYWNSTVDMNDNASLTDIGILDIDSDYNDPLLFDITSTKQKRIGIAKYEFDVEGYASEYNLEIPKSAYCTASIAPIKNQDGSVTNWYGLTLVNGKKQFVKLDGGVFSNNKAHVIITVDYEKETTNYNVDGNTLTYKGESNLPVDTSESNCRLKLMGSGRMYSMYGNYQKYIRGFNFIQYH